MSGRHQPRRQSYRLADPRRYQEVRTSTARSGPLRTSSATAASDVDRAMDLDERPCRCGRDDGFGRPPPSLPRLPATCKKRPLQGLGYGRVNDVSKCVRPAGLNSSVPVVK